MREVITPQPSTISGLDRAILALAPGWGTRRLKARQEAGYRRAMLSVGSNYTRAYGSITGDSRERERNWMPLTTEDALLPGWDRFTLLSEGRQAYRTSSITRALVDGVSRRIGTPKPDFQTDDEAWNEEAAEQYEQWAMEQCDYRQDMTLEEMDEQIIRAIYTDGDIGEIFVDEGGDLRLQLIESDRIAPDQRVQLNLDTFNPMQGVVLNWKTGRVEGYLVGERGIGGMLNNSQFHSAGEMALYKRTYRTEQVRGVPMLAPILNDIKDFERYLNAVRIAQTTAASFGVFIERNAAGQFIMQETKPGETEPPWRKFKLEAGKIVGLNPGEQYKQMNPTIPGQDFEPVSQFFVRKIARGGGSIYELVMGDFSGMSFSASKNLLTTFVWNMQDEWQDWLIRNRHRRILNIWLSKRMEATKTLPFNPQAFTKVGWIKSARVGIDPLEDAEATIKLIASGLLTYRRFYAAQGLKSEIQIEQAAKEAKLIYDLAKEHDVPPEAIASTLAPGVMISGNGPSSDPAGPGTTRRGGAQD